MIKLNKTISFLPATFISFALLLSGPLIADSKTLPEDKVEEVDKNSIINGLAKIYPGIEDDVYTITSIKGDLYMIVLNSGGTMIWSDVNNVAIHDLSGRGVGIFEHSNKGPSDKLEVAKQPVNKNIIKTQLLEPIEYKSPNEIMKLDVFFEPFCGYCQLHHNNIQSYLEAGFTISYYPYPMFGELSNDIFAAVWSITDTAERKKAFAHVLGQIASIKDPSKITLESLGLPSITETGRMIVQLNKLAGKRIGITGTPASVSPDGVLISGAAQPSDLKQILNIN